MNYPVNVFIGSVRDYPGSRPSAIAKREVDGEMTLTARGLKGDQQAEKKIHGGIDRALSHYPREHYASWAAAFPEQAERFVAPAFGGKFLDGGADGTECLYWRYLSLGKDADSGDPAALALF